MKKKYWWIVGIIVIVGVIGIYFLLFSNTEEKRFIEIAKQTAEIKEYLELYPNSVAYADPDYKLCIANKISSEECYWIVVFSPTGRPSYVVSQAIESFCDKAYARIWPNGTVLESKCVACDKDLCG